MADKNDARELAQKFKVGQVVMWNRASGKRPFPALILEVIQDTGEEAFYRIDQKNCLAEHMVRPLTEAECGESLAAVTQERDALTKERDILRLMVTSGNETELAVRQERDALRRIADSLIAWAEKYPLHEGRSNGKNRKATEAMDVLIQAARAAAEESQPK